MHEQAHNLLMGWGGSFPWQVDPLGGGGGGGGVFLQADPHAIACSGEKERLSIWFELWTCVDRMYVHRQLV